MFQNSQKIEEQIFNSQYWNINSSIIKQYGNELLEFTSPPKLGLINYLLCKLHCE